MDGSTLINTPAGVIHREVSSWPGFEIYAQFRDPKAAALFCRATFDVATGASRLVTSGERLEGASQQRFAISCRLALEWLDEQSAATQISESPTPQSDTARLDWLMQPGNLWRLAKEPMPVDSDGVVVTLRITIDNLRAAQNGVA